MIGVIHSTTIPQLVYLKTIEIKIAIHFLVSFHHILLPIAIARYLQIDIACPRRRESMIVLIIIAITILLHQSPLRLHTIVCSILPCTKAKVIEDGFHAVSMLCGNIVLDIFHAYTSIANIGIPLGERTITIQFYRSMVHPLPVLELHTIDMQSIEICHLALDVGVLIDCTAAIIKVSDKAVTWKTFPIAGNIYGYRTKNIFHTTALCIQFHQITLIIGRWWQPSPLLTLSHL